MSRGVFNGGNKTTREFSFQTNISSASTFNPTIRLPRFTDGQRVHIDFGDGSPLYAVDNGTYSHTYTDSGITKTVTAKSGSFSGCTITFNDDNIIGSLDLSPVTISNNFNIIDNPNLTGVTHGPSDLPISVYSVYNCNITGQHDVSNLTNLTNTFAMFNNPNLTGVTHGVNNETLSNYQLYNCNLTGELDLSTIPIAGFFRLQSNPNLTNINFAPTANPFTSFYLFNCDITGNFDLSPLSGFGGDVLAGNNTNLTGITHTYSNTVFSRYDFGDCNITGEHNLTMFPNLGGSFLLDNNPNLTSVIHTASTQTFTAYNISSCNITGQHDLSMFPNLGGGVTLSLNDNLTGVTHTSSSEVVNYSADRCDLTGNFDLSMFPNLSGVRLYDNPNLTGVTHTQSNQTLARYEVYDCNITGELDLSMFPNLGGRVNLRQNSNLTRVIHTGSTQDIGPYELYSNISLIDNDISMLTGLNYKYWVSNCSSLTGITLPPTTGSFRNDNVGVNPNLTAINTSNNTVLGYIDFNPLSGATMDVNSTYGATIRLDGNNMTSGEVNRTLVDFSGITSAAPERWSGVTLDISNNSDVDTFSDGYNGYQALQTLTGFSWDVTIDGIIPPETSPIIIGDPNSTSIQSSLTQVPWSYEYDYSFAAMIIPQSEMGLAKTIDSIEFKVGNISSNFTANSQKIIMGHITETDFSSNTPNVDLTDYTVSNKTTVKTTFSKSYTTSDNDTWIKFDLTTSTFNYNGTDSLVIMWENKDGTYTFTGPNVYYDSSFGINLTAYDRQDSSYPTGQQCSLTNNRPIMKINFS